MSVAVDPFHEEVARIALAVAAFARYGLDRTQSARLRERFSGWPR